MLLQHSKIVAYVSRQLKEYEKNNYTHDLELVAVVFTLKIWLVFLILISKKELKVVYFDNIGLG